MGRIEKKFQKKKERERAVRKKILACRANSREFAKEEKKKYLLEKETNKKTPVRRMSPELQKTLEIVEKLKEKDPDVDSTDDKLPNVTTSVTCVSETCDRSDGK